MSGSLIRLSACIGIIGTAACGTATEREVIPYTTLDTQIDSSDIGEVRSPRLCVDGTTVYAVWHDDRRGPNQVFFAAGRGSGAIWDPDTQLSNEPSGQTVAEYPTIACAGGSVYVVWEDNRDSEIGHRNIYMTYSDDGGRSWQAENIRITDDPEGDWDTLGPQITVDYEPDISPDKKLAIVWYDNRLGAYDIYFTRSDNGYNIPAAPIRLDTDPVGSAYSAHPKIVTDGLGGVYVVWQDTRDGGVDLYFNRSIDWGVNWQSSDLRLDLGDPAGASDAFGHTIAVDRGAIQPAIYVAWHDDRNGGKDILLNASHDGGASWSSEPQRLENDEAGAADSFYPSISADADRVLVAWHDDRNVGFDIYVRGSRNGGDTWDSELRIDRGGTLGASHSLGALLATEGERAVVAYTDYRTPVGSSASHPDLYYQVSLDSGDTWMNEDLRIDDDPIASAISDDPQMVLAGPFLYLIWVDYRSGDGDLWFRAVPSNPEP